MAQGAWPSRLVSWGARLDPQRLRHLRSKIILSFCLLMMAGGTITTVLVRHNLSATLSRSAEDSGMALARTLALELGDALAYADRLEARRLLMRAREASRQVAYLFVAAPDGTVTEHSFAREAFPLDLLALARRTTPVMLHTEDCDVRDLPTPILGGTLGTLHVGVSMAPVEEATWLATRNVAQMTALAMGAGVAGIFFLASLITRPVRDLTQAARRLGQGELTALAPVAGEDELAGLALTFNQMAQQIRERVAESEGLRVYLERVLDHQPCGVTVISADRSIEYANRVVRESHGAVIGRRCCEVLDGERPCSNCATALVLRSGQVVHQSYTSPAGRSYELTFVPFVGRDGRQSVVETSMDVTAVRQLGAQLQRAERLATAGEVAAGIVHSINNPLDGIRRALDLARRHPDDPDRVTRMLAIASEGAERIAGVTRTLLDLARADTGTVAGPVALPGLIEEVARVTQLRAQGSGVTITLDVEPGLPPARADHAGLHDVLVNLVLNAVDATPRGGAIVIGARDRGAEGIEMSVADTGTGVPPEHLERIFEPFFTTKEVGRGTGLGLSLARRIVEAHGGDIRVESSPGKGATFRVRLPAAMPTTPAALAQGGA